jgi:hypothetical protein
MHHADVWRLTLLRPVIFQKAFHILLPEALRLRRNPRRFVADEDVIVLEDDF